MNAARTVITALVALLAVVPAAAASAPGGHVTARSSDEGSVAYAAPAHGPVPAAGTSSWPTYMFNVERTGANPFESTIGASDVAELEPVWSVASNGSDFSAPIVVDGVVYFGSWNGEEYAVSASSGSVLWQTYLGTDTDCGGYTPMGISSTPAYANGTLYLGGGDGYWYALNASSGAVDWRILPGSEADGYYAWASALVYGSSLYVGTASCFDDPLVPASLLQVSLTGTHDVTAQFNTTPPGATGESIWTTPALDPSTNTVWVSTGNENPPAYPPYANAIIGLNATTLAPLGSWQVPNVVGQDSDFGSTPTLFRTALGTPMIVASNKNGVAYALNRSNVSVNGTWGPAWNLSTGGGFSGGAFDGSTLYLAGDSTVYAVDPANGTPGWTAPMAGGGGILGSLTWANGLVYAGGGSEVEAIDAANGSVLWNASLPAGQSTVTEPVVEGGMVFVASGDYGSHGQLTAYGLEPWAVRFEATGVPSGKSWTASLAGSTSSSGNGTVVFYEPNGTYRYLVRGPAGYRVAGLPPTGTVTVAGANATVRLAFVRGGTVAVTFRESGLPPKTLWCVSLAGLDACSLHSSAKVANLTPASYPYAVALLPGYLESARLGGAPAPLSGVLNVTTRTVTLSVAYAASLYAVTIGESGLAPGHRWSVRLIVGAAGHRRVMTHSSTGASIAFSEPNGTFTYGVRPVAGYTVAGNGSVVVNGSAVSVFVVFSRVTYSVTFSEVGLAPGTTWGVTLDGTAFGWTNASNSTNATTITFVGVPNGSFVYRPSSVSGYAVSVSGSFRMSGPHGPIVLRYRAT